MSKISKILLMTFFGLFALVGVLIAIGNATLIGDAVDVMDLFGEYYILIQVILLLITGLGILAVSALPIVKHLKHQELKVRKSVCLVIDLVGCYFVILPLVSIIRYGFDGVPGELVALLIFGVLTIVSTIAVNKIKVNGEEMNEIIALPVVGGLAAIASIICLTLEPQGIELFAMILVLLGSIYLAILPLILKYGFNQTVEGVVIDGTCTHVAGTTHVGTSQQARRTVTGVDVDTLTEELRKAKAIFDEGLIDEEEYKKVKDQLINRL